MKWKTETIQLETHKQFELFDLTSEIEGEVYASEIKHGLCIITVPHATAALIANENEAGLKEDMMTRIQALAPEENNYKHDQLDNNARAHIIAGILGPDLTFVIEEGRLVRGAWQNIFFVELDGPRSTRKVVVKIFGEK
ncbi:secondary thiamine-phosphate synthase enzyme YjbQ [Patescibacteria group bacterium]|nr:secondary thiamine-phosphate synthase enzyme YjbQ [Patescibacteria group bacterium]MBU1952535.1 secondary thiamine-phosphate synthase enzyme YjbQ [Patescibacteria group bacterium]MBU2236098.1 secondary thiamine-phosphate synthase enzyme YjbQ [Patescibacteria group bacterium]